MAMASSEDHERHHNALTQPLLPPSPSPSPSPSPDSPAAPCAHENGASAPPSPPDSATTASTSELPLPATSSAITPFHSCSFLSRSFFCWIDPVLRSGFSSTLRLQDVPRLAPQDSASALFRTFSEAWISRRRSSTSCDAGDQKKDREKDEKKDEKKDERPSLGRVLLCKCFLALSLRTGFYALLRTLAMASGPLFLLYFLDYTSARAVEENRSSSGHDPGAYNDPGAESRTSASSIKGFVIGGVSAQMLEGYLLVLGLLVAKTIESTAQRHWYFGSRRLGMQMRSAVLAAVFEKELRISSAARKAHSAGEIVNYVAIDAYRVGEFPWYMHYIWTVPLQMSLAIGLLFFTIGLATIPGLAVILCTIALNAPLARSLQRCQSRYMEAQDRRLRATAELLNSIKVLKLQAWEDRFQLRLEELRDDEFRWLSRMQSRRSVGTILYWLSPVAVSSVVFAACIWSGRALDATTVFTVLATFRIIQDPVRMVPEVLAAYIQVVVSLDRLQKFLDDDELLVPPRRFPGVRRHAHDDGEVDDPAARDEPHADAGAYRDEPHADAGAYRDEPHADDAAYRDEPHDAAAYRRDEEDRYVIRCRACSFSWNTPDAAQPPTLKGIDLGIEAGQKIAVCGVVGAGKSSLISALLGEIPKLSGSVRVTGSTAYVAQSAWIQSGTIRDNILFGRHFDKMHYRNTIKACLLDKDIKGFPFGDLTEIGERGLNLSGGQKQRIQLARAVYSDSDIYLLDDPFSAVDAHTAAGLFKDCVMGILAKKTVVLVTHQVEFLPAVDWILVMQGGEIQQSGRYADLLRAGETFEQLVNAHHEALTTVGIEGQGSARSSTGHRGDDGTLSESEVRSMQRKLSRKASSWAADAFGGDDQSIQLVSEEETGKGDMGWKPYKEYLTISGGLLVFAFLIIWQALFVIFQVLSNFWLASEVDDDGANVSQWWLVGVYALLSVASGVFVHLRSQFCVLLGLKGSRAFFYGMTRAVLRAPMSFFDSTPTGRILSRASTDLSLLDIDMPFCFGFVVSGVLELLGILGVIAVVTWEMLILAVPMVYLVQKLQHYYVRSAQELMRLNATTKAPIVNFSGEAAQGAATIRAFGMVDAFKRKNLCLIDNDSTLYFHNAAALEWLIQRLELLSNAFLCATGLLLVIFPTSSPGFAGLALTYALSLTGLQVFFVQWQCKLVNYIVSVERVSQYMHLPAEGPPVIEGNRPPGDWPSRGEVVLENLKIRYAPQSPLVLRGITCTFEGGRRIGVVGRTGSGKTTLIGALFRLVEPAAGRIVIDGVDACSIGLHDLRSRLGIIPQEPTLFRGTVRYNLDPLQHFSDQSIWQALDRCQLGKAIRESPLQLDAPVSDEGSNWSAGQRQLFCLGRVLLKQSKILVLDEATASVDSRTDALLQKVIRDEFVGCTVVTVAHRIPTVVDSDMVLALSDGTIAEYDSPTKLLKDESSLFAKLVLEYWSHANRTDTKTTPSS